MGDGYSWECSFPVPSWPDEPLPHERSWRVTSSEDGVVVVWRIGSLLVVVVSVRRR